MSKLRNNYRNVIVIGASAGGVEVMIEVLRELPADLPAAILIVQHIPAYSRSHLDRVLQNITALKVVQAIDGMELEPGTVYVPQADRHLMVENDRIIISKGPRENRFRPAVDTLFRSAAHTYLERAIGVVMSGALNDGTSGMWTIKRMGGLAIVQDPEEAMFPDMPLGVMEYTEVDHVLGAAQIGRLLNELVRQEITPFEGRIEELEAELLRVEIEIAKGKNALDMDILAHGTPSSLVCPECHGALTEFKEGALTRFRCHTGHAYTAESLLASVRDSIEKSMWEVMRGMEESKILLDRMATQFEENEQYELAARYRERAQTIQQQSRKMQASILQEDLLDKSENRKAKLSNGIE